MKQIPLFTPAKKRGPGRPKQGEHGGSQAGRRKEARPFDPKERLHLTLKSLKAQGSLSMIHPKRALVVKGIIERAAKRHGVRVERLVNVGNHLHLLISTHSKRAVQARVAFQAFLKEIAGLIARAMSGAKKGSPQGKFWDDLAWSRIVRWGKDLARLKRYFAKNEHDAALVLAGEGWPEWLIHQAMISSVSVRREK